MTASDSAIVRRVLDGDTEAFAVLVGRHHAACLRLATHVLGTREDAEDAVQETFLRAYRHLGRYEERERFTGWLFRVLVNQCRTTLARRRRLEAHIAEDAPELASWDDDVAEGSERDEMLRTALARLHPMQREAVLLRFSADLSYEEMAAATGAGVSALKMRVKRACARLRAMLGESIHA
ncbi:MAG TPA: sigma-70 family RNA polymerase sigma factor [Gemmatimonadaceae bacterium]|nr:sigma-70 family RNA polymerase sigma factor [Gemmatimonadaceae bacterium]